MSAKINWDKVKDVIGAIAPTVGAALGGPFGAIAGKAITEALGETDEARIVEALQTDPNKVLELKKAELAFQKFMRDAELTEDRLAYADTADSRRMAQQTTLKPQVTISALMLGGYFALLLAIFTGHFNPADGVKEVTLVLVGLMLREIPTIMQFWFGTSIGSKEKSAQIAADIDKVVGARR